MTEPSARDERFRLKKAVALLRVSSKGQLGAAMDADPDGLSIGTQRASTQTKAVSLSAEVVEFFIEPGYSASKLTIEQRPVFKDLWTYVTTHRDVEYVIVYMRSRIFRNRYEAAIVEHQLKQLGIRLVSVHEDFGEGPYADAIAGVVDVMNQLTTTVQGLDIQEKMRRKAVDLGGTLGRAKLGYLNVTIKVDGHDVNTIRLDEQRAPLVLRAFELYATNEYSIERLEATMADLGLTTKATKRYPEQPVSGSKLHTMLSDPYYIGFVRYKGQVYPGRHEPLVSHELFERVQEVLGLRSGRGQRDRVHQHHLKGFLFCQRCRKAGRTSRLIYTEPQGRGGIRYRYFVCRGRQDGVCNLPHLPVELVEQAVIDHYDTLTLPADFITEIRARMAKVVADETTTTREMHAALTRRLKELDDQEDRLIRLMRFGSMPEAKIRTELLDVQIERERAEAGLTQTSAELAAGAQVLNDALHLASDPQQLYQGADDATRRLLNETFYERFYLDDLEVVEDDKTPIMHELHDAHCAYRQHHAAVPDGLALVEERAGHPAKRAALNGEPPQKDQSGPSLASVFSVAGSTKAAHVGMTGFEPATLRSQSGCATKLRYIPFPSSGSAGASRWTGSGGGDCRQSLIGAGDGNRTRTISLEG